MARLERALAQTDDGDDQQRKDDDQTDSEAADGHADAGLETPSCTRVLGVAGSSALARIGRRARGATGLRHGELARTSFTAVLMSSTWKGLSMTRLAPARSASSRLVGCAVSTITGI